MTLKAAHLVVRAVDSEGGRRGRGRRVLLPGRLRQEPGAPLAVSRLVVRIIADRVVAGLDRCLKAPVPEQEADLAVAPRVLKTGCELEVHLVAEHLRVLVPDRETYHGDVLGGIPIRDRKLNGVVGHQDVVASQISTTRLTYCKSNHGGGHA